MNKKSIFTGAGVALITPMKDNGDINFEKFDRMIDDQIAGGTDAIIVCGTTGEASTMNYEEHLKTIDYVTSYVNKRIPVIAGVGSNNTASAIYMSKEAQKLNVDGVLVVAPYYNKATQKGLIEHFGKTAEAIDIPLVIYNIPGRTGVNVQPETVKYLAENFENIVAIKDAAGNLGQTAHMAALCGDSIDIYSGDDNLTVPILSLGGKGVISVLSHVAPRDTHDMVAEYLRGNVERSREIQLKYIKLIDLLFSEVNPIPVKAAMNMLGYEVGGLRLPLTEMEEEHKAMLKAEMVRLGIL